MTDIRLDFDGRFPLDFDRRTALLCRVHRLTPVVIRVDRTRHGWHVIVTVAQRVAPMRVVLLQALWGSDWKRETFNSRRVMAWRHIPPFWRARWNVLYARHHRKVTV